MKGKKLAFALTAGLLTIVSLAGCGKKDTKPAVKDEVTGISFAKATYNVAPGATVAVNAVVTGTGNFDPSVSYSIPASEIFKLESNFVTAAEGAESIGQTITVTAASVADPTKKATANVSVYELAQGYADFTELNPQERGELLGILEKYANDNFLTGITFFGNGGYVMYADGIQKGTNSYIPGYGFGILAEGNITKPLTGPQVTEKYNMYYHSMMTSDPKSMAEMNSGESDVTDLVGYSVSSYFDTVMNETKDGYNWVKSLAKVDRPIPVDLDPATGKATTYKFPVRVGAELKYNTNSTVERFAAFNGREAALEDYLTPYKIYYTQAYGLKRSTETFGTPGELAGTKAYYDASKDGFVENAWKNVGIKAFVDENDGESYLQLTFVQPLTPFYAMYYSASGMFAPVPESFILACGGVDNTDMISGVKAWGVSNESGTESPADHFLSTGPYTVEAWNKDANIVYKKNPYYDGGNRYQIAGVHIAIMPGAASDIELAFNEFLDGNLSSAGIPSTKVAQYKTDPRTTQTKSSSHFNLNVNSCDADTWEELFGEEGTVTQTPKANYWNVKPAMHNTNFLKGLSYSINRVEFNDSIGRVAAIDFFADTYLIDPENGISYNSTDAHKAAIKDRVEGTEFGYSLELAKKSFKLAADELIENGDYEVGDEIEIEIAWMYQSDIEEYAAIGKYMEDAFNAAETGLTLKVKTWAPDVWSDVYYKKMLVGQFDLGFGSISGNTYDPLSHFDILSSDPAISGGFCLNWRVHTNEVDGKLVFQDKCWSFDALIAAGISGAIVKDGANAKLINLESYGVERLENGDFVFYLAGEFNFVDEENYAKFVGICLYAYTAADQSDYAELYVTIADEEHFYFDEEEGVYVVVFTAEQIAAWLEAYPTDQLRGQGIDLYFYEVMNGKVIEGSYGCGEIDDEGTEGFYYTTVWSNKAIPAIPSNNP